MRHDDCGKDCQQHERERGQHALRPTALGGEGALVPPGCPEIPSPRVPGAVVDVRR